MKNNIDFFCIGDLHLHTDLISNFLDKIKPTKCIFLGDFLDSHNMDMGDAFDSMKMGLWLNNIVKNRTNDIFILSNHDVAYRFPLNNKFHNWGWRKRKHEAFHSQFDARLWDKFKIFHTEKYNELQLVFSHAGFLERFLPNSRFDETFMRRQEAIALKFGNNENPNPWLDDWRGPLWIRWNALPLIEGICMVVGHTPMPQPSIMHHWCEPRWNLNLDCAHTYIAHFKTDGIYSFNLRTFEEKRLELAHENSAIQIK